MAEKKYIAYDDAFHALDTVAMPLSTYECLVGRLCDIPAADVAPVRHGRWSMTEDGAAFCSACKRKMNPYLYGYAHCAMCGAPMDGGDTNG